MCFLHNCGHRASLHITYGTYFRRVTHSLPNLTIEINSTLKSLLNTRSISFADATSDNAFAKKLEVISDSEPTDTTEHQVAEESGWDRGIFVQRKSPAASYGGKQIGQVILPNQLQNAICSMIFESDKTELRTDAQRLFCNKGRSMGTGLHWNTVYGTNKYRSRKQAIRYAKRDGIAFASIAHTAHYAAISAVLHHVNCRLEPEWKVRRVIDWGTGTGSGLWAAVHAFRETADQEHDLQDKQISGSSVSSFLAIENRDGLASVGKRLLRDLDLGDLNVTWSKTFREAYRTPLSDGRDTLALSAFMLTSLATPQERKALVREMWESGAHVMVLIDQNTDEGFQSIAEAREYLLRMGKEEIVNVNGRESVTSSSYVVAPCPHDGPCPLFRKSTRLTCGFSQRIQRPPFVRKTKHSGIGHEDVKYSYVVVRRGSRPWTSVKISGRVGEVSRWPSEKFAMSNLPIKELQVDQGSEKLTVSPENEITSTTQSANIQRDSVPDSRLHEGLRLEAFSWPRLVFPPLKRGGHVILDSCTPEGKIMRMIIPKSQGKQVYYDARKSRWGDLFPHSPKNPPQERHVLKSEGEIIPEPALGRNRKGKQ